MIIKDNTKPKPFGEVEKGTTIYFLDPVTASIQPCFVLGNLRAEKKPEYTQMEVLIVPASHKHIPIAELPMEVLRKVVFYVKKSISMALVDTKPQTIYATTLQEIEQWMGKKSSSLILPEGFSKS